MSVIEEGFIRTEVQASFAVTVNVPGAVYIYSMSCERAIAFNWVWLQRGQLSTYSRVMWTAHNSQAEIVYARMPADVGVCPYSITWNCCEFIADV